jgi:hypothetical protein
MYGEAGVPVAEDAQLRHETTGEWLDGVAATTAGPYGDTGALTGFWLLDCEDADRAVEIAARLPAARAAAVEVRPLMAPSGMEM